MNAMPLSSSFDELNTTSYIKALTTGKPDDKGLFFRDIEQIQNALGETQKNEMVEKISSLLQDDNSIARKKGMTKIYVDIFLSLETGFTKKQVEAIMKNLESKFESDMIVPLKQIGESNDFLIDETRGPTDAFKDLALQMLTEMVAIIVEEQNTQQVQYAKNLKDEHGGHFQLVKPSVEGIRSSPAYTFKEYLESQNIPKPKLKFIVTQTSTSGDTGPAGQNGILGKDFIINIVGYPQNEATYSQRAQMNKNTGENVLALAFDSQFTTIQKKMLDKPDNWQETLQRIVESEFKDLIDEYGFEIEVDSGSFNSINPGRIDGQMTYHTTTLLQAQAKGLLDEKGEIIEVIPSGNGGHVYGVLMAREMTGIKGDTLITCNKNDMFYNIIENGRFTKPPKESAEHQPSVSMIIEFPNNMYRLFTYAFGATRSKEIYDIFESGEEVILSPEEQRVLNEDLRLHVIVSEGEEELKHIGSTFKETGKLICPHTSNAKYGLEKWRKSSRNTHSKALISETASPWKFLAAVAAGLSVDDDTLLMITYQSFSKKESTKQGCQELLQIIRDKYEKFGRVFSIDDLPFDLSEIYKHGFNEPEVKNVDDFHKETLSFLKETTPLFRAQIENLIKKAA